MIVEVKVVPIPKPRMTKSDKWKKRPVVERYWAFKDELVRQTKEKDFVLEDRYGVVFFMPMPKYWSKKQKAEMFGKPHQQKPDLDNLVKAVNDCLKEEDKTVYEIEATKCWWNEGKINFYKLRRV